MHGIRVAARACIFALALTTPPLSIAASLPPATEDEWVEVTTPRFRLFSNAGPTIAVKAARHLERLADAMQRTTRGMRVDAGRESRAYVFKSWQSFEPYSGSGADETAKNAGYQFTGQDFDGIAFYPLDGDLPMSVASHEFTHIVVARSLGQIPVWTNEGLAEFYSTFRARSTGADIGDPIPYHIVDLRRDMLPIENLILTDAASPDYRGGERRGTFYAESWALVHTLVMDGSDGQRFGSLLSALAGGTPGIVALRTIYGPNVTDSLQARLREVIRLGALPYTQWQFSEPLESSPVQTRSLDRVEMLMALGELLLHARNGAPAAHAHLEEAWRADSARVLTAALLGELAEQESDRTTADRWFARVSRSVHGDPRAFGIAGTALAQRARPTSHTLSWPAHGAGPDALAGRALLNRALAERPDDADWLAPFGLTFLEDSAGVYEGIGALIRAQGAWPRRPDIMGGLSILNLRAGNRAAALAMYNRIPGGADRWYWRWLAGWLLVSQTWDEANRLVDQERFADAESLAAGLRRDVTESGVAADCDRLAAWISDSAARASKKR